MIEKRSSCVGDTDLADFSGAFFSEKIKDGRTGSSRQRTEKRDSAVCSGTDGWKNKKVRDKSKTERI